MAALGRYFTKRTGEPNMCAAHVVASLWPAGPAVKSGVLFSLIQQFEYDDVSQRYPLVTSFESGIVIFNEIQRPFHVWPGPPLYRSEQPDPVNKESLSGVARGGSESLGGGVQLHVKFPFCTPSV